LENQVLGTWHRDLQEVWNGDKQMTEDLVLPVRCGNNTKTNFAEEI
jgi:hypothetical protein